MIFFAAAIFIMGSIRFALTMSGFPNDIVKYASMSVIILAGIVYFGIMLDDRRERLKSAFVLIIPYMIVEIAVLGYSWATGRDTIFHTPEYSFNTPIHFHTIGHLIGGLTWEPLIAFLLMETVWRVKRIV